MVNPKQKGNLTELQCLSSFIKLGYGVSIPYGDCARYDFIADVDSNLLRIQVKTSKYKSDRHDTIVFSCRSTHSNRKGTKNVRYSANEIDYFATYWNNKCYIVPVEECSIEKTLRFEPSKNNQQEKISYASEYEIDKQLQKLFLKNNKSGDINEV